MTETVKCISPIDGSVYIERPLLSEADAGHVEEAIAKLALTRVANKMPLRCRFVRRHHGL